ncbi:pyridoxal phosphate-dependent aminotransferase [Paenarthrobacter histidinolovorans]|uniref:pyridoxal phosphate-dependent aminotransferase n=1 Tax=Paenarthrobacter histidinolovorans TaxID=43664 RepID=UPI001668EC06|nr:pyridoxal phosphate-dependent aminotransferase [Paenarthrobacter histidinolovorans]GGJ40341.1 aminotransferase [Paenarthrobacter histidinolovorans]
MKNSDLFQRVAAYSQRPLHMPERDLILLEGGEPHFATPPHIIEAMTKALQDGYTHYPPGAGDSELREALATRVAAIAGTPWTANGIYITHGAAAACNAAIMAFVNPGDRVVLPNPTYSLHADQVIAAGGIPVFCTLAKDFHLDLAELENAAEGATMLVLTNPSNPTGVVYSREELAGLAEIANRHDLVVVSDEVYHNHVFDGFKYTSALAIPELRDRLIYTQTFGKSYAMTGWRIGYMAGPVEMMKACRTVHRTLAGSVNTAVQRAALAALDTPAEVLEEMRLGYQANRDLVQEHLSGLRGVSMQLPEAAFYTFVKVDLGVTSAELVELAASKGVTVRSGAEYGPDGEGFIRIAFCVPSEVLREGLIRLRELFEELASSRTGTTETILA